MFKSQPDSGAQSPDIRATPAYLVGQAPSESAKTEIWINDPPTTQPVGAVGLQPAGRTVFMAWLTTALSAS